MLPPTMACSSTPLQMGYTDVPAVTESTLLDLFLLAHADYLVAGNVTVT